MVPILDPTALCHTARAPSTRAFPALRFAILLLWALLQQFILQTVILREARGAMPRRRP